MCGVAMEDLHRHKKTLGKSVTKCGSKHAETTTDNTRYNSPVDPTYGFEQRPWKKSSNHSMIWEESKKSRARTGFSQERKTFVSKELVNPRHFVLSKERWIHHKELREELWSRASWSHKRKQKTSQTKHKTYEIEMKSNPRRAQGGKGLLSHSISVQSLKNP